MPIRKTHLLLASCAAAIFAGGPVIAGEFNIPRGELKSALDAYAKQTGAALIYANGAVQGIKSPGASGDLTAGDALNRILNGTGFVMRRDASGAIGISRDVQSALPMPIELAQAAPVGRASVETVTVTSSKLGGQDVQTVPIAITALSQEQLTATQTAGGPDLVKQ
ncbi:MAG TPA: STN domain-containing protein, partial [Rhizomicrobium sp.]|nr:STN domain-containing protein [Rhizomicrobium sp.]